MTSVTWGRRAGAAVIVVAVAMATVAVADPPTRAERPRFYHDDPLVREPETRDASKVEP